MGKPYKNVNFVSFVSHNFTKNTGNRNKNKQMKYIKLKNS